jgi:hypothetical protein
LFDSIYAEAVEAEKSLAALSTSVHKLISILEDTKIEARL